jgi:subtilisin family serine protease
MPRSAAATWQRRTHVLTRLALAVLVVGILASAAPAQALPPVPAHAWWYTELNLPAAWKLSQGKGVTVAVVDSGVDARLGDLRGQVLPGTDFTGATRNGWQDVGPRNDPLFGHGTDMAAMIAGTGRGTGLIGVAPQAKILPVRVGRGLQTNTRKIAAGIRWASRHGAQIINLSVAAPAPCAPNLQSAVDEAVRRGILVVAGTGNSGIGSVDAPANCVGALAVGGIADSSVFTPWSGENYGSALDFVAPAQNIRFEFLNGQLSTPRAHGTSSATAIVSGVFALLRSAFPHASARDLVTRALYAVHNGLPGKTFAQRVDNKIGYGEILPYYALKDPLPAHARNPIYDAVATHLAAGSATSPSPTPSTPAPQRASPDGGGGSGGGSGIAVIAVVVAAAVLVGGAVLWLTGRRRRRPRG